MIPGNRPSWSTGNQLISQFVFDAVSDVDGAGEFPHYLKRSISDTNYEN